MKKHKILIQYRGGLKNKAKFQGIIKLVLPKPFFKRIKSILNIQMKPVYTIPEEMILDGERATATAIHIDKMIKEIDGAMRSALIYGIGFTSFTAAQPKPLKPVCKDDRYDAISFTPIMQVKNIPAHAVIAQA